MKPLLSPKDLAQAIGVSESSIKRWVDNGEIQATKTAGGHRRTPISEAVRFLRETRSGLVNPEAIGFDGVTNLADLDAPKDSDGSVLFGYLKEGKAEAARGLILSLYLSGRSVAQIVDGPLSAALARVGELWREEECGIFWEHRATEIAISAISRLRMVIPPRPDSAPSAVGAAAAGDPYIIPTLCAAAVLESQGLNAVNLGADTPIHSIMLAARAVQAQLIWVSLSVVENPEQLQKDLISRSESLGEPSVPIIIGGSQSDLVALPDSSLYHVGTSMGELEAMVKGLQLRTAVKKAS